MTTCTRRSGHVASSHGAIGSAGVHTIITGARRLITTDYSTENPASNACRMTLQTIGNRRLHASSLEVRAASYPHFVLRFILNTAVAALLAALLSGCVVTDAEYNDRVPKDQRAAAITLERQVIPKLLAVLTPEERRQLGPVSATVTASLDPARIALEQDARKGSRPVVSTSFLALQDALVDGSVIASATTGREQQLVDYPVMAPISRWAGAAWITSSTPRRFGSTSGGLRNDTGSLALTPGSKHCENGQ